MLHARPVQPPRLAEALLRSRLPKDVSSRAILGDLREDYLDRRAARPTWIANAWYWGQALSIAVRFLTKRHAGGRSGRTSQSAPGSHAGTGVRSGMGTLFGDLEIDLRFAAQKLVKSPGFTVTTILTLSAGIGATVAMFSVLDAALIRSLPFPEPERLVFGRASFDGEINPTVSYPDYIDFRDQSDAFESFSLIRSGIQSQTITGGDLPERVTANWVTVDLFGTLGVDPQLGRHFAVDEARSGSEWVVMLSHGFWQRHFGGSADAVGSTLIMEGLQHTVVGVMPAGFRFRYDADLWLPIRDGIMDTGGRGSNSWLIVGRLRSGISIQRAQTQIDVISRQLAQAYPESHQGKALLLTSLGEALAEDYRPSLIVLMAATGLLLLVACGNVASLLVARATTRKVELSVRAALGASRTRLLRQLFAESVVMATVAGSLGAVLALWLQRLILTFLPLDLLGIREVGLSAPMLGFALAVSAGTAVVFGAGPALTASQANPAEDLKAGMRNSAGHRGGHARAGLVVLQVALSVLLISGSGLLLRSFVKLRSVDVGFETENLLTAALQIPVAEYADPDSRVRFFRGMAEDIRTLPGVKTASLINMIPIRHRYMDWSVWDPANPPMTNDDRPSAFSRTVLPGYFETMGITFLFGRDHNYTDADDTPPKLVISESLAEALFPGQSSLGRPVSVFNSVTDPMPFEVVGVVRDIRITSLEREPFPQMYFNLATWPGTTMNLVVRTASDPIASVSAVRSAIRMREPDALLTSVATMDEILSGSISANRVLSYTLTLFGATALFLAMTGLYGVLAFYVESRRREIGIRVTLGATTGHVFRSVLRRGMVLVGIGLAIGLPSSLAARGLLRWQLFGVESTDPTTYTTVAFLFLLIGALACIIPARRALGVDPVEAVKAE